MTDNVVLITIDSLRYDGVGCSDYDVSPTPTIDALATDGVDFRQATANGPNTRTSFPSILTSTYPLHFGGYSYLDDRRPFVAESLRDAGFLTVGYHSNPFLGSKHNYGKGFEEFNDAAEGSESVATLKDRVERRLDPDSRLYGFLRRIWHYFNLSTENAAYAKAQTVTGNVQDWLKREWDGDQPFFMWIHYMDVHYPFMPPADALRELGLEPLSNRRIANLNGKMHENPEALSNEDLSDLRDLYHAELRYVDRNIGRVIETLDEVGALQDTLVIITADHGEAFGEHGNFGHPPELYDELLHVPLIFHGPSLDSKTVQEQVSLLDIGPTIYDILDIGAPDGTQGESMLSVIEGQSDKRVALSAGASGERLSCRTDQWKCFWRLDADEVELYDLVEDSQELHDVSADNPDVVERFQHLMSNHLDEAEQSEISVPDVDESEEAQQRLRELGYLE